MVLDELCKGSVVALALLAEDKVADIELGNISLAVFHSASGGRYEGIAVVHERKAVVIGIIKGIAGNYVSCLVAVAGSEARSVIVCPRDIPAVLVHLAKI